MEISKDRPRINYSDLDIGDSFIHEMDNHRPYLLRGNNRLFDWDTYEILPSPFLPTDRVIRIEVKVTWDWY